jgi:DNA-binding MarR family transcriptional regulator
MENRGTQLRNDTIARQITAVVEANTKPTHLPGEIESLLDRLLPGRRARAAARTIAAARISDKHTSLLASLAVNVGERERLVLSTLHRFGGALTTVDIGEMTGIRYDSITPRMKPLTRKGLVREAGVDTSSSRGRTLYEITPEGVTWIRKNVVVA